MRAIEAAFRKAGGDPSAEALYATAAQCMQHAQRNVEGALPAFLRALKQENVLAALARDYLARVARDMNAGSEGRTCPADNGRVSCANASGSEWGGEAGDGVPKGQPHGANPPQPIANGEGQGSRIDEIAPVLPNAVREPITISEAGRVLRTARPAGAGALQAKAYETRITVRGESWLMSYAVPGGPRLLDLTWDDAEAMQRRMFREGGERVTASLILGEALREREKLGSTSGSQIIGKTLPPSAIDRIATKYAPEKVDAKARAMLREHARQEIEHVA